MPLKTFTVDEADRYVPQLEILIAEMIAARDAMKEKAPALENMLTHAGGNGGNKTASEYLLLLQRFNAAHDLIREIGCEFKDLDQGLIDFPSIRDGRLVYLCWKRGEPRIMYWHELDTGFVGRQKLEG